MAPSKEQADAAALSSHETGEAAELAQAYQDLTRGEQTATALENNLSNLEGRLDAMLAALEAAEASKKTASSNADEPDAGQGDKGKAT